MIGVGAVVCIAIAAVGVGIAAGIAADSAVKSAEKAAEAQKYAADKNAQATVQAAKEAANAQIKAASYDAKARMHENDVAFQQEMEYLKQEKWHAQNESDEEADVNALEAQIDGIDSFYLDEGEWGGGSDAGYDYGYGA